MARPLSYVDIHFVTRTDRTVLRVRVAGPVIDPRSEVIRRRACIQPRRAARPSVQLASGQRRDERTVLVSFSHSRAPEFAHCSFVTARATKHHRPLRSAVCSCASCWPASCSRIPRSPPAIPRPAPVFPRENRSRKQKFLRLLKRLRAPAPARDDRRRARIILFDYPARRRTAPAGAQHAPATETTAAAAPYMVQI